MVKDGLTEVKTYWNEPKPGNYVSWKEIVADIFAVAGEESMNKTIPAYIGFGCLMSTFIYQIPVQWFTIIGLITGPIGYLWTVVGMNLNDNLGFLSRKTARTISAIYTPLLVLGLGLLLFAPVTGPGSMENVIPGYWKYWGINLFCTTFGAYRGIFWKQILLEKIGRYKTTVFVNLIPNLVLTALIIYIPFDQMTLANRAWILCLLYSLLGNYGISGAANAVTSVITPNEQERIFILAFPGTLANGINSIWGFAVPALASYVKGTQTIEFYRIVLPATFVVAAIMYYGFIGKIKERLITPPMEQKPHINFWTGLDAGLRNKYRWIGAISGVIDGLGTGIGGWIGLMWLYMVRETDWIQAVITTLMMTAYTPGILLSSVWNKIDYRKLYFFNRLTNVVVEVVCIVCLLNGMRNPIHFALLMCGVNYFSTLIGQSMNIVNVNMGQNQGYYQQWISGERVESHAAQVFGWLFGPIGALIGFIIPYLYKTIGYTSNQDVLYMEGMRTKVLLAGCVIAIIGDIACLIPYFWFKFPKKMVKQIVGDLEWRREAAQDLIPVNRLAREGKMAEAKALLQEVIAEREARYAAPPAEADSTG
jgi:Na+/melibiose symporter-like transporter